MSVKAAWLLTTDLVSELECKSPSSSMPIYVNRSFWSDLKKTNLIDWIFDPKGISQSMLGTHPVYDDPKAPDYTCSQDIVDYYWAKKGGYAVVSPVDCGCRLNGAHELYCEKWQPY